MDSFPTNFILNMDPLSDDGQPEAPPAEAVNGDFENEAVVVPEAEENGAESVEAVAIPDGQDVTSAILGNMDNMNINNSTSPVPAMPREEPETIKAWRKEHEAMLQEKDAKEAVQMEV